MQFHIVLYVFILESIQSMHCSNHCIVYYDSLGAHFIAKPSDKVVKTGSTVTFVWIYESTGEIIEKGELMTHINSH